MSSRPLPRVLLVEDDRSWQQILTEILGDAGLVVDVFCTLDEATAGLRLATHRLAIVDLALGTGDVDNQDGLSILESLRRHDPDCVPIMLTGYATVELAVSVLTEYGAFSCLRKEAFDRDGFLTLVNRALARPPVSADLGAPSNHEATVGWMPRDLPMPLVLVVEDDAGWRDILSELLSDAGYRVRLCSGFAEAAGYLRREQYRMAIVDLWSDATPAGVFIRESAADQEIGDGYRLLERARASGLTTLVVSGFLTHEGIERAYSEYGVYACLEKQSFDRQAFLAAVSEVSATLPAATALASLTGRECQVLTLLAQGKTNKEIARELVITPNTVKRHIKAVFAKLRVHTRSAAVALAVSSGIGRSDGSSR